MFISGFFGIIFKIKSFFMLIFICFFYVILLSMGRGFAHLPLFYSDWWFIESYLFVMLFAPAIELSFQYLEKKTLLIIGALFYYSYIGRFFQVQNSHDFIMLMIIYVLARFIAKNSIRIKYIGSFVVLISLLAIVLFTPVLLALAGLSYRYFCLWFQNNIVFYLLLSVSLVLFCKTHAIYSKTINWFSTGVLAIYLLTDNSFVRNPLDHYLFKKILSFDGYIYIILLCILCLLIDKIRHYMFLGVERSYRSLINRYK